MTRAAHQRGLTQPAVSAQLSKLEELLGHVLFDRTPKGMVLTEAGRVFLAHVEGATSHLAAAQVELEQLSALEAGALAIGGGATATTYLLPPLLGRFHGLHPAVRLFVREQGSQSVVEAVQRGELDLGVVTLPISTASGSQVKLAVEPWIEDELRLIVPPNHSLRRAASFEWSQLSGQPFVLFEAGSAVRSLIDRRLDDAGIRVEIAMELRSIESIKQMVAQGIGAAFVSRFALANIDQGVRCDNPTLQRDLAIIYRRDRTLGVAAQAFLRLMHEAIPR